MRWRGREHPDPESHPLLPKQLTHIAGNVFESS